MTQFYSSIQQYGNRILVREVRNGKRQLHKAEFKPTLFVKTDKDTKHKSLFGDNLEPIKFLDINDAKKFVGDYKDVENFPIFGNTSFGYQYITENYPGEIEYDLSHLTILTIDIETASENGFPSVDRANEEVLLITVQDKHTKKITTFGAKRFDVTNIENITNTHGYEYVKCKNEEDLLETFLQYWNATLPDIVTGWNTSLFDIPYLVNRIRNILGEDKVKMLSPWKLVNERKIHMSGKEYQTYDIMGVNSLDYLDLYKKFTYKTQESYKLDYIAQTELGKQKLDSEYETFKDFYTNDWQRFVEYNVVDVELVDQLEDKMRLIELITTMAFDAKCNFADIYSAVRTWDCILYNHLWNKNIIVQQREGRPGRTIEGAYVKQPIPGRYEWVVSVDAASLYPSIILQYNMSPETFVNTLVNGVTVESLLNNEVQTPPTLAMAANGYCYKRDVQGLFPEIVEKIFTERVFYKKKMIAAEQAYEKNPDAQLKKDISKFNNIQMARKIQLNSLYGALANEYFRFYDDRIAEGITLCGQFIIRSVAKSIDEYLNKVCGTEGIEFAFYSDTDSCYISFDALVKKFFKNKTRDEIIDIIDKICEDKLVPIINKSCDELATYTNAYKSKIAFKREVIAEQGIWVAKKRYALNVHDSEGVRYKEPKLKVMGLEIVRSSTPTPVRKYLKDAVRLMLTASEREVQDFIRDVEDTFMKMPLEEIAFPRSVNGLTKYSSSTDIYAKATPMHVRGVLLHNYYIKQKNLSKKYELIGEGAKVKFIYLKMPNPIRENCIAFSGKLPKELDLHRFIDYDTMFSKSFLDPITQIMDCLKWSHKPIASLDMLF